MLKPMISLAALGLAAACNPAPPTQEAAAPTAPEAATAPAPAAAPAEPAPFESVATSYDPAKQRFIWVLPPGLHGKGPWEFKAIVKHKGDVKFETALPLKAEILPSGSRPEFPAGYEVVRLVSNGDWAKMTAEIDKVINDLIAQHGRGDGEVIMQNDLSVTIDDAHRKEYCVDGKAPDVRAFVEDDSQPQPIRLDTPAMAPMLKAVVQKAC